MSCNSLKRDTSVFSAFTLVETLLVTVLFSIVIVIVFQSYDQLVQRRARLQAQHFLIQESSLLLERLHRDIPYLTIDYEEYFARRLVWCDDNGDLHAQGSFSRNIGDNGICDNFTSYGNHSALLSPLFQDEHHHLYHCSTEISSSVLDPEYVVPIPASYTQSFASGSWCFMFALPERGVISYGQYAREFVDVRSDEDGVDWPVGDADDALLWYGPMAVLTGSDIQELYLTSPEGNRRFFVRRVLKDLVDVNADGVFSQPYERRYALQVLELHGLDAWSRHDFVYHSNTKGLHDWIIDTWVCNASAGYYCGDSNQDGVVNNQDLFTVIDVWVVSDEKYVMPLHVQDGWVDITGEDVTVLDRSISLSPRRSPSLAFAMDSSQMQTQIGISLVLGLYGETRSKSLPLPLLKDYNLPVHTSFSLNHAWVTYTIQ